MNIKIIFIFGLILFTTSLSQVIESGFGSSSLLHIRRGGLDENRDGLADGSYAQIFSQKTVLENIGEIKEVYNLSTFNSLKDISISKAGDINSDGMDDIICAYKDIGNYNNGASYIKIFDGNSGEVLFEYLISDQGRFIEDIIVSDFDGDARSEIILVLQSSDNNNLALSYLDLYDNKIRDSFITQNVSIYALNFGDVNGDNKDDLIYAYTVSENNKIVTNIVGYDIANNKGIFHKSIEQNVGEEITQLFVEADNLNEDIFSEIVVGLNWKNSVNEKGYFVLVLNKDGEVVSKINSEKSNGINLSIETLTLTNSDKIFFSEKREENNNSKSSMVYTEIGTSVVAQFYSSDNSNSQIWFAKAVDINKDGLDEILFAENYFNNNLTESRLLILDMDKNIQFNYDKTFFNSELKSTDQIIWADVGDFNNDDYLDVAISHNWGRDKTGDEQGDNSFSVIIDIKTQGEIYTYHPFSVNSGGYGGYKFVILNNDFTDEEFLKTIKLDSDFADLNGVQESYNEKKHTVALQKLFEIYKTEKLLRSFPCNEMYSCERSRFSDNLKKYSTTVTMENECTGTLDSGFPNHPTAAGRRLGRIIETFWYRIKNNSISYNDFALALKSIYSHLVWSSREGHFVAGTNHGTIFELNSYIPSLLTVNICKEFNNPKRKNWLNYLDERVASQLKHVMDDGVQDEHSYYYVYRVLNAFNKFQGVFNENSKQIDFNFAHVNELTKAVENSFYYLLYSIKPIEAVPNEKSFFIDSDIPAIGDSRGIFGRMFGKNIIDTTFTSFLEDPLKNNFYNYWIDKNLKSYIQFIANPLTETKSDFNLDISKYFNDSGIFISRSNWLKEDNKTYDHNARYCYFKGGEMIPTPGPYYGFLTSSKHAHADLLSVELSAYNKNLIVELGGYVNPNSSKIIKNFDINRYSELYGYNSKFSDFLSVRHYFKGTAAHNTCFVNNIDQAEFIDHYKWDGLNSLYKENASFSISDELDYYSAAYTKNWKEFYTHRRNLFYIKPKFEEKLFFDYWFFTDEIRFTDYANSEKNKIEQIWHLAGSQDSVYFSSDSLKLISNNMLIISDKTDNYSAELINSYNQTGNLLVNSKSLKFILENSKKVNQLCTIVFPFGNRENFSNFNFSSSIIRDDSGNSELNAISYKFAFSMRDKANNVNNFKDYIFVSQNKAKSYNWLLFDGKKVSTENNKFILERYKNGVIIKRITLSWNDLGKEVDSGDEDFNLDQNYPNPFSSFTTINYQLKNRSKVELSIHNLLGQKIKTLVNRNENAGAFAIAWNGATENGTKVASGIYFYQLSVNEKSISKKMILLK